MAEIDRGDVGHGGPASSSAAPSRIEAGAAAAIDIERLSKSFKGVEAVRSLSFRVPVGSVTALLGGNGAGKTTTIGMIMGLVRPSAGTVRVLGADMTRERHRVLHRMNFESPYVDMPHRLTVEQNLRVFARLYGVRDVAGRIAELAESLALTDLLDRQAGQLSAGQKTRVALAKALVNTPEVLLLDEPTASLDPDTADWIRGRLEAYRNRHQATVLLASHNMAEVERLCDRVMIMRQGTMVADGSREELLARFGRQHLEEVFLDVARSRGAAAPGAGA